MHIDPAELLELIAASAAPAEGREPTGDELRKLVREIRDASGGPSDAPQPADYVIGGWRAAIATAPTKPAEWRDVKAYLYQHKQSGKTTFVTPELSRDEFEGMNPEYAYVGALVLATAPTMSEADIKQWRWVTANGTCSDWQDTSDDEIENLAENPPSRGGYYEIRKLRAIYVDRIDRAAAKGGKRC
jgi:hypothetical protein